MVTHSTKVDPSTYVSRFSVYCCLIVLRLTSIINPPPPSLSLFPPSSDSNEIDINDMDIPTFLFPIKVTSFPAKKEMQILQMMFQNQSNNTQMAMRMMKMRMQIYCFFWMITMMNIQILSILWMKILMKMKIQ